MSNAVGRAFYPRSGQTKDYKIGICCFSTNYVALRRKSKDWSQVPVDRTPIWYPMSWYRPPIYFRLFSYF